MADTIVTSTQAARVITLSRAGVELVLDLEAGYPTVLHWGAPLAGIAPASLRALKDGGIPHSDLDEPVDPGMLREAARGFTGRPALRGHRGAIGFSPLFAVADVTALDDACTVRLVDGALELGLELRVALSPEGVLLIDATLKNNGDTTYTLDELAMWLPVPDRATETLDFTGRWLRERQAQRLPFAPGLRLRESREGRSGHDYTIVQCALTADTTTEAGEVWALGLLWSGGSRHLAERAVTGRGALGAGELIEPGEAELAPGDAYTAPTVAAFYSEDGLDGLGARAHAWLRSRPTHPSSPRPVTLNVWEAVYFDHDLDTLSRLAEVAAGVGVERFVLDDGWFGSRRDDWSGLGDWEVSPEVWPDGLGPLVERVRALGMQFGLWFEGEMVNPDSDLYRAHPDWILQVPGRVPPLARHQLVLDLANPDAYTHVLEQVHAVISEHRIDYIKWDHNRFLTDPGHVGEAAVRRQTEAIYRLFDELRTRSPGLEIESCASGGGRIDLGMAQHADRFWTSDQNDALERQQIQRWTSLVIPPEMLGTHIGPTISHGTGRRHGVQMRAVTALFGHAGIEWNLLEATEDELEALRGWTQFYRSHRGLLHGGRTVRVDHPDPSAVVHGVVAHDRSAAVFAYVQCTTTAGTSPAAFRVPGLDPDAVYRVHAHEFETPATVQRRAPAWLDGLEVTGAALARVGLRPPILWPEQAVLAVVERVS
ncbi:alpha-galactosidase [Demequina sp. SYSU T00192]|uniref:alpha-galactosidase n=1 Tax=Demequina litoralis TaxID=3051660 RepID=A0ABT8GBD2_9MICO|nr:alpha-galactosidase [Demequina sp. SYSU T00192]MDN4476443.1 alpha-galactosidase [Demequina sp. SYSU T00192]